MIKNIRIDGERLDAAGFLDQHRREPCTLTVEQQ